MRRLIVGIALALGAPLALAQGVSKNEIVLGTAQDMSGPAVPFSKPAVNGMRMRIDEINEADVEQATLAPETVSAMDTDVVVAALQEVDEAFRAPLTLFYIEELSNQEIADVLEIPMGTVMSRLSRGKGQLRTRLLAIKNSTAGQGAVVKFPVSKGKAGHG